MRWPSWKRCSRSAIAIRTSEPDARTAPITDGSAARAATVVQALDEAAKLFYGRFGFRSFSESEPLMLLLRISELKAFLDA